MDLKGLSQTFSFAQVSMLLVTLELKWPDELVDFVNRYLAFFKLDISLARPECVFETFPRVLCAFPCASPLRRLCALPVAGASPRHSATTACATR